MKSFASVHKEILSSLVDAEQLLQLFRLEPKIIDGATKFVMKGGAIEFNNVHFSYEGTKQIIKGVSFSAQPGQKIALVGETGGGKSTLLKLLFRFYDVTQGSILIDGQDVRGVTVDSLRSCFGVVPQDPSMFNDTVMNNVRYAKLDATDEEVMEACKAAVVHDKIISFTDGYQSIVGEKGVKLSGGELQRLAIARAILKHPAVILLDEATSSVDTDTESRIQSALHALTKGRTTFTVAHRLSTIVDADVILVIKDGEVVEQGPPKDLIAAKKEYYSLWCKQVGISSRMIDTKDTTEESLHARSESEQAQPGAHEHRKLFRPDAPEFIPSHSRAAYLRKHPAVNKRSMLMLLILLPSRHTSAHAKWTRHRMVKPKVEMKGSKPVEMTAKMKPRAKMSWMLLMEQRLSTSQLRSGNTPVSVECVDGKCRRASKGLRVRALKMGTSIPPTLHPRAPAKDQRHSTAEFRHPAHRRRTGRAIVEYDRTAISGDEDGT